MSDPIELTQTNVLSIDCGENILIELKKHLSCEMRQFDIVLRII